MIHTLTRLFAPRPRVNPELRRIGYVLPGQRFVMQPGPDDVLMKCGVIDNRVDNMENQQ
jgi:hypothetical protein